MNRKTLELFKKSMNEDEAYDLVTSASTTRKCGSCTACCFALGIDELAKEPQTECPHRIKLRGCAIYDTRPKQCKHYFCLWKLGFLNLKDSPDKIGVIVDGMTDDEGNPYVRVTETKAGALEVGQRGWHVLNSVPSNRVFVIRKDGSTVWMAR